MKLPGAPEAVAAGRAVLLAAVLVLAVMVAAGSAQPHRHRGSHHFSRREVMFKPGVQTDKGVVIGELVASDTGPYIAFRGVPYATPPLADLRFKNPEPAQPWSGHRYAVAEGPKCSQIALPSQQLEGQEDCLYLNVYVPTLGGAHVPEDLCLPVMVYLHGGGFQYGSGTAAENGPEFLVHHGVILVTLNYRLGAFGFLNLDNDDIPGNMGLKDQLAALKWVRANIAAFGGDPNNVVIFGNSAGSAAVNYHSIVPASEGLFSGAIMQSGNALAGFAYQESNHEMARRLAAQLSGSNATATPEEQAAVIRKASAADILAATVRMIQADPQLQLGFPAFGPSPERRRRGTQEKFLEQDPESLMLRPQVAPVPTIAGLTGEEGLFAYAFGGLDKQPALKAALSQNPALLLPPNLAPYQDTARLLGQNPGRGVAPEQAQKFGAAIKDKYSLADDADGRHFISLLGDLFTAVGTRRLTDLRLRQAQYAPLYLYHFLEDGDYNWGKISFNLTAAGPTHTDELGYLMRITSPRDLGQRLFEDSSSSNALYLLTKLWTDFAKTRDPLSSLSYYWPAAEAPASAAPYVKIQSNTLTLGHGLGGPRLDLWQDIFGELRTGASR